MQGKLQNDLIAAYRPKRNVLAADSPVTIATLMAAREGNMFIFYYQSFEET